MTVRVELAAPSASAFELGPVVAVPALRGDEGLGRLLAGAAADVAPLGQEPGEALRRAGFSGKAGEAVTVAAGEGRVLVVVGLGSAPEVDREALRRFAAAAVRQARASERLVVDVRGIEPSLLAPAAVSGAVAEGAVLGAYGFDRWQSAPEPARLERVVVAAAETGREVISALERGEIVAEATCFARDLVNEPAGQMTPARLAEAALGLGDGLEVEVWDAARCEAEGLGGLLGVARGSAEPPCLIRLRLTGKVGGRGPLAFVGKGITFDSGGLSLKTPQGMMAMKTDMAGGAAVLGAMRALARLGSAVDVLGFVPATENMPGGRATKPGDVLRTRSGKTIEVLNTDAEGRLVLSDALALALEAGAKAIVDLATLTGACVSALGPEIAGLMGNHDGWLAEVADAAEQAGEQVWRLPLPRSYRRMIDSDVADMKNIGETSGAAGAITAALLLAEFVGEVPWAHLDIAGPARSDRQAGYVAKGATGFGVRTLVALAEQGSLPGER